MILGDAKDGSISMWDTNSFQNIQQIAAHEKTVTSFCFLHHKNMLLSTASDHSIHVRKISPTAIEKDHIKLSAHTLIVRKIIYSAKHNLLLSGGEDPDIKLWDGDNFLLKGKIETFRGGMGFSMILIEDENFVGVGFNDGYIDLFSLATKKIVMRINSGEKGFHINCLSFLPNQKLLVANVGHDRIKIWRITSKNPRLIKQIKSAGSTFVSSHLVEDQKTIVIPANHQYIRSFDIYSGKLLQEKYIPNIICFLAYNKALALIVCFHYYGGKLSLIKYY